MTPASRVSRLGITGHQKLPAATARLVDAALRSRLDQFEGSTLAGVSCLCEGADQLFAQAIVDRGGTLEVVVPAEEYRDSLDPASHAPYDALIAQAQDVETLPFKESTEQAHLAGGQAVADRADRGLGWQARPRTRRHRRHRRLRAKPRHPRRSDLATRSQPRLARTRGRARRTAPTRRSGPYVGGSWPHCGPSSANLGARPAMLTPGRPRVASWPMR
jgi:hypothetical protein